MLARDAAWCGQCLAPVTSPSPTGPPIGPVPDRASTTDPAPGPVTGRPVTPRPAVPLPPQYSRWAVGPTTFGPIGRVVVTLILVTPYAIFWANPFGWLFLAMWTVVVMPLALRDVWERAALPPAESGPATTPAAAPRP